MKRRKLTKNRSLMPINSQTYPGISLFPINGVTPDLVGLSNIGIPVDKIGAELDD